MNNISNTTNLNIRVDSTLKQEADMLFKDLGLNMTTAINMFLVKSVKTASIPFEISEPKPSRKLNKALAEADKMISDKIKTKTYNNVEELFKDLNKD